ncbi:MAG: acyl-CoA dehydrogenase family protein [Novosphingobium sp.]
MSELDALLTEPFRRLLADIAPAETVRAAERMRGVPPMWQDIIASGFLDALVPAEMGGAGLALQDVFPLVAATGEQALPVPFAETMVARALLAASGVALPGDAVVVLAPPSAVIPLAAAATHALVQKGDMIVLVALDDVGTDPFGAGGGMVAADAPEVLSIAAGSVDLSVFAAGLVAAKMAGAMVRLLDMSVRYANERVQFGRPLGKFQAIQQQLAVMAEQAVSAQVAARIGMSGAHFDPIRVAMAKARASEASHIVVAIAHAVHGAIGVTEEYDLQLLTRRLKQWQLAFGSESHWASRLGTARLAASVPSSADFIRQSLADVGDPV